VKMATMRFLSAKKMCGPRPGKRLWRVKRKSQSSWTSSGRRVSLFVKKADLYVLKKVREDSAEQILVPMELRRWVLFMNHNLELAGHQGHKRMIDQIRTQFFWTGVNNDIKRWVKSCSACKKRKTPRPMRSGITTPVFSSFPNHTVAIDIVGPMNESTQGNRWILTMIDVFTRWPVAVAMPNRESRLIAKIIYRKWICDQGVPIQIISDQGRELVSRGLKYMCRRFGTRKIETSGYNPTGNASVERFHRYFMASISILHDRQDTDWDDYVDPVLFSYRASVNDTTGFSPFFLETGRHPNLPAGALVSNLQPEEGKSEEGLIN